MKVLKVSVRFLKGIMRFAQLFVAFASRCDLSEL